MRESRWVKAVLHIDFKKHHRLKKDSGFSLISAKKLKQEKNC